MSSGCARFRRGPACTTCWRWCCSSSPAFRFVAGIETSKSVAQVARDLGVCEQTPGNWVKKDRVERGETEDLSSDDRAELARLRSENAELRMERGCPQALRGRVGEGGDAGSLLR